jgi:hypothetical protein
MIVRRNRCGVAARRTVGIGVRTRTAAGRASSAARRASGRRDTTGATGVNVIEP